MSQTIRHNPPWTAVAPVAGMLVLLLSMLAPGIPALELLLVAGLFGLSLIHI